MAVVNPDRCIACTICQAYCPVAKVTTNFLGPRLVGPAYERFRLLGISEEGSLHYCSDCKNCDIACPHGVPISTFNMLARGKEANDEPFSLRNWILGHGGFLAKTFQLIPSWLKNFGMSNPATRLFLDIVGISKKAPIPKFNRYFRRVFSSLKQDRFDKEIVFFSGCYIDAYDYQTGLDIVWILNKAGYKVIVPDEFRCCGLPMVSNGFIDDAKKSAEENISTLMRYKNKGVKIVTGCPSCALMFKKDLPEYFPDIIEKGYSGGVIDLQEFLLDCIASGELKLKVGESTALYHAPCHLRASGIGFPSIELMELVGITVENAQSGCCGISGSYGFKKEKYDIGMEIGSELFGKVCGSSAEMIVSECGTCRTQIEYGAGRRTIHPITAIRKIVGD